MAKDQFVGTWQLVSSEFRRSDGTIIYPFGQDAVGNIYYDATGYIAAQLMRSDRPVFASGDIYGGTPQEINLKEQPNDCN